MTSHSPLESLDDVAAPEARARELRERIVEMEALEDSAFGRFTVWDWLWCTIGAVVLPGIALWWFAA